MFTTPCFIRKNTPELMDKLEKLGYEICPCTNFDRAVWLDTFLLSKDNPSVHGIGYWSEDSPCPKDGVLDFFVQENLESKNPHIDCGTNEEMFLALAALRDDTDNMQWFVSSKEEWVLCERDSFWQEHLTLFCRTWRKATADDIIEHFSMKGGAE